MSDRAAYARQWRATNPEKSRASDARTKAKNRAAVLARKALYRSKKKDKIRQDNAEYRKRNPEKMKAWREKWKAANPHKLRELRARRRTSMPPWVDKSALAAVYKESARLTKDTGIRHQVDHMIPITGEGVCGLHVPWNLRIITAAENRRKGNRLTCP